AAVDADSQLLADVDAIRIGDAVQLDELADRDTLTLADAGQGVARLNGDGRIGGERPGGEDGCQDQGRGGPDERDEEPGTGQRSTSGELCVLSAARHGTSRGSRSYGGIRMGQGTTGGAGEYFGTVWWGAGPLRVASRCQICVRGHVRQAGRPREG